MKKEAYYGMEVVLDIYGCDPQKIRSRQALRQYVDQLCKILRMKKFGKTLLPHFGHANPKTSGFSLLQFIETSSITAHFSENRNCAYLNIFSCVMFSAKDTINFTKKFFGAKRVVARTIVRK